MLTKYIGLCLGRRAGRHPSTKKYYTNLSEKSECNDQYENPSREAAELVDNLFKGFKQEYPELKSFGYWQRLAKLVLERLEKTLQASPPMSKVMADAFQRSKSEAQAIGDFVHDHPIIMTVIALGILVLLAPWVIEALGFGAAGPVEGTTLLIL